jgi:hypothetical protein
MDDPAFESHLGRLFAEAPSYPDSPLFAASVESRLGRGWALRRVLIAAAGVAGGLIAVAQIVGSGLAARIGGASRVVESAREGLSHLPLPVAPQLSALGDLPFGGEVVWLVVGLAVLAGALLAGRSIEDI